MDLDGIYEHVHACTSTRLRSTLLTDACIWASPFGTGLCRLEAGLHAEADFKVRLQARKPQA